MVPWGALPVLLYGASDQIQLASATFDVSYVRAEVIP